MINWIKDITTAFFRVALIFLFLSMSMDSVTRIYYSYMPITTWMDFQSVTVLQKGPEAVVDIVRQPIGKSVSLFHRTLLIRYPQEQRGCTNSTMTIIDDPAMKTIEVPLERMLSESCTKLIDKKGPVNAVLQVSYVFDFPYGVKRTSTQYSNKFALDYDNDRYVVSAPVPEELQVTTNER